MKTYFKKYFKRDARKLPSRIEEFSIKADAVNHNRECSCQFKPALKSKNQIAKTIKVEMVVESAAIENRETFLGQSEGIKNNYN